MPDASNLDPLFVADGAAFLALPHAVGPWSRDHVQGSASAALLARAVERARPQGAWQLARLAFDLWRPVSLQPVEVAHAVLREGQKAVFSEASLTQGGRVAARATALWLRSNAGSTGFLQQPAILPPPPETGRPIPPHVQAWSPFFGGVATRVTAGDLLEAGPAAAWFKLQRPLVAGEENSALVQAVSAADLASGIAALVDLRTWSFINADLTLHLWREPASPWILVDARTCAGADGAGQTTAALSDAQGRFGTVTQSLIFERRRAASPDSDASRGQRTAQ